MPITSVELREQRAKLIAEAREVITRAEADAETSNTEVSAESQANFDRLMEAADKLDGRIRRLERVESETTSLDAPLERRGRSYDGTSPETASRARPFEERARDYLKSPEYRSVFAHWAVNGQIPFDRVPAEYRDTILGTDSKGGFLVAPTQLADEVVKQVNDFTFIRKDPFTGAANAKVITLGAAKSLGVPQLSTRMADAQWTTEVAAVTEDTTMALGRRDLTPNLLSKLAKISIRTLQADAAIEGFVTDELGYKFGVTEEKGYLTGSGTGQPLGMFTASASGVPTSRDVSTGNTTTAIVADNLFAVKYSLKQGYLADPTCAWVFHRDAVRQVVTLKDSQNRYLWEPSLQNGQPDRLLGIKVYMSEYLSLIHI